MSTYSITTKATIMHLVFLKIFNIFDFILYTPSHQYFIFWLTSFVDLADSLPHAMFIEHHLPLHDPCHAPDAEVGRRPAEMLCHCSLLRVAICLCIAPHSTSMMPRAFPPPHTHTQSNDRTTTGQLLRTGIVKWRAPSYLALNLFFVPPLQRH